MKVYLPELDVILSGVITVDLIKSCHPTNTYRVRFVYNRGNGSATLPESFEDPDLARLMIAKIANKIDCAGKDGIARIHSGNLARLIRSASLRQGGPDNA